MTVSMHELSSDPAQHRVSSYDPINTSNRTSIEHKGINRCRRSSLEFYDFYRKIAVHKLYLEGIVCVLTLSLFRKNDCCSLEWTDRRAMKCSLRVRERECTSKRKKTNDNAGGETNLARTKETLHKQCKRPFDSATTAVWLNFSASSPTNYLAIGRVSEAKTRTYPDLLD